MSKDEDRTTTYIRYGLFALILILIFLSGDFSLDVVLALLAGGLFPVTNTKIKLGF